MPETIVPQAQAIRAEAERLFFKPQPPMQGAYRLPKHYPVKQIESLLLAVMQFAREAELVGRLWDQHEEAERRQWETMLAEWDTQEEDRQFMEACAAEHTHYPGVLAG
jgi:hypothetical protein